jgi:CHASE3 domain sensor protein
VTVAEKTMGRGWTLRNRLRVLVLVFLLLTAAVTAVARDAVTERDAALAELSERHEPAREVVADLLAAVVDQQTGVRGYLLSHDPVTLEVYAAGTAASDVALQRLDEMLADSEEGDRLTDVRVALVTWQEEVAQPALALAEQGRTEESIAVSVNPANQRRFDDVRRSLRELRNELVRDQVSTTARFERARGRVTWLLYGLLGGGVLVSLMIGVLLSRWVTDPLEGMARALRRVRDGDLHHPIPGLGPSEIATVGEEAEAMRAQIVALLDDTRRAREGLAQQGAAVMTLRAELDPKGTPPPQVDFAASFRPAEGMLAGDWYDCVDLGAGQVALVVMDVSGHGAGAGVFAVRAKHLLLAGLREDDDPGAALGWLSRNIGDTGEMFLTCLLVVVDTATGTCRFASAGHPSAFIVGPYELEELHATGPMLGPLPGSWETLTAEVRSDDMLVAWTDGVVEARRGEEELGLVRVLAATADVNDPKQVVEAIAETVRVFTGGVYTDDVTVVALSLDRSAPTRSAVRPPDAG